MHNVAEEGLVAGSSVFNVKTFAQRNFSLSQRAQILNAQKRQFRFFFITVIREDAKRVWPRKWHAGVYQAQVVLTGPRQDLGLVK